MDFDQPRNRAVVRSAIDLARNMDLQATAEGVETESAYLALRYFGCELGQGYFLRPSRCRSVTSHVGFPSPGTQARQARVSAVGS